MELDKSTSSENKRAGSAGWVADEPCPDKGRDDGKYTDTQSTTEVTTGQNEKHAVEEKTKESDACEQHIAASRTEPQAYVSI